MDRGKRQYSTSKGFLIIDDTVLDKQYAKNMDLVYHHWSGKHHRVVSGIDIITTLWTNGNAMVPVDFRIYDKDNDLKTKNDHFKNMLEEAKARGFFPDFIIFDGWYASIVGLTHLQCLLFIA